MLLEMQSPSLYFHLFAFDTVLMSIQPRSLLITLEQCSRMHWCSSIPMTWVRVSGLGDCGLGVSSQQQATQTWIMAVYFKDPKRHQGQEKDMPPGPLEDEGSKWRDRTEGTLWLPEGHSLLPEFSVWFHHGNWFACFLIWILVSWKIHWQPIIWLAFCIEFILSQTDWGTGSWVC